MIVLQYRGQNGQSIDWHVIVIVSGTTGTTYLAYSLLRWIREKLEKKTENLQHSLQNKNTRIIGPRPILIVAIIYITAGQI